MCGFRNIFWGWGMRDNFVFLRGLRFIFRNFIILIEFNKFEFFKRGLNENIIVLYFFLLCMC